MLSQNIFEQIHLYLSGEMNEKETKDFEQLLQENAAVNEEFVFQKRIKEGLKAQAYKKQFQNIHQQLNAKDELIHSEINSSKPVFRLPWKYLSIAASVFIILGFWWIWTKNDRISTVENDILTKNIPPISTPKIIIKEDSTIQAKVNKKIKFQSKSIDFEDFIQMPEALNSPFQRGRLMGISPSSIALWEADSSTLVSNVKTLKQNPKLQSTQVLERFQALQQSRFENVRQQAEWYEALVRLSRKELKEARKILNNIAFNKTHPYQSKAILLVKKLD